MVEEATDQHRVHIHVACLQVLAHGGDLVVGQVRRVVLVQLQQTLQLVLGFVTDVLRERCMSKYQLVLLYRKGRGLSKLCSENV